MTDMDSPFQQHLGTNYVPSVDEAKQIQDFLEISSKEVHAIDVEINQLHQQLELLQAKRLKLSDLAEQHRALLSPVRRLSRDILEAIFLACFPTDRNPCMSATEAPMLLTQVSSSWRNIAHSTPRLWAAIHIVLPSVNTYLHFASLAASYLSEREALLRLKLTQREAGTKEWLERAGTRPLSISIYQSLNWANDRYDDIVPKFQELHLSFIGNTILSYHKRWHGIDMYVTKDTLNGLLRSGPDGLKAEYMTMLKHVHISAIQIIGRGMQLVKWTDIVGLLSSQVTTATISGIGVSSVYLSSTPKHVWGHLAELDLELHTLDSTEVNLCDLSFAVICHCLALKILKLNVMHGRTNFLDQNSFIDINTWPQTMADIPLHQLTMLSLSLPPTSDAVDFVKHLYLPSIRQFDFEFKSPRRRETGQFALAEEILKMALRASGGGVSLGLYDPYWIKSLDQLLQVLQHIPYLTSLKLSSTKIKQDGYSTSLSSLSEFQCLLNDDLLSALSPAGKNYSEIICPQLEVLDFDHIYMTKISEQGLRELVQARRHAHLIDRRIVPLRKLCMSINDYKQDVQTDDEVSLEDSALYFRKRANESLSPREGLKAWKEEKFIQSRSRYNQIEQVVYTKL
ncbi:hypothetical protein BDQ17DRAFT_1342489 [Cyathus striatus]|nr:hypothetical protein BDQ17DRAFT_1342489 [Cyathus striatus]